eukprot:362773-Hanusia_phi.AAC.1
MIWKVRREEGQEGQEGQEGEEGEEGEDSKFRGMRMTRRRAELMQDDWKLNNETLHSVAEEAIKARRYLYFFSCSPPLPIFLSSSA